MGQQILRIVEDGACPGRPQIALDEPSAEYTDARYAGLPGGLPIVGRVADHDGAGGRHRQLRQGGLEDVRVRLRPLRIVSGLSMSVRPTMFAAFL